MDEFHGTLSRDMSLSTEACPPVEEIAAFLDGKLSGEERDRMIAHLADCESCYALFAEAARFHLEEERETGRSEDDAAGTLPFPRKRLPAWALPVAAALLLGLATIPIYRSYTEMPSLLAAQLIDSGLLAAAGEPWSEGDTRGERDLGEAYNAYDFLTGVHLVDLHLTLARNDSQDSLDVLSRLHKQFDNFLVAPEEARSYDQIREEIVAGKTPSSQLDEAARLDASLTQAMDEADAPYLAFGKWAEAGRLAAIARQPGFFEDRDNRRFLDWLLRHEEEQELDKGVVRALKEIRGLLKNGEIRYDALRERFEAILRHYEFEAAAPL